MRHLRGALSLILLHGLGKGRSHYRSPSVLPLLKCRVLPKPLFHFLLKQFDEFQHLWGCFDLGKTPAF